MLKGYWDGSSGKSESSRAEMLTLGGLITSASVWGEIETAWWSILAKHPELRRGLHMTDAIGRHRDFAKWNDSEVAILIDQCLELLSSFRSRGLYYKSCTINLRDYMRFAKEILKIIPAQQICINMCCGSGLPVDEEDPSNGFPEVEFYFDINEQFRKHIQESWEWLKARDDKGWSKQVKQIGTAAAYKTPALQAADLVSWTVNAHYRGVERAQSIYKGLKASLVQLDAFYDYNRLVREFDKNSS